VKAIYQKLIGCPDEGFAVKEIHGDDCNCPWHCHPEAELILVLQSHGYRIVGDSIQSLQRGDLVLLGPNLPHAYQHKDRLSAHQTPAHCVLLQFEERFWSTMLDLPAMAPVRRLLQRAAVGLQVQGATRKLVAAMLLEMLKLRGLPRIAVFLQALDALAHSRNCRTVASSGFPTALPAWEQERVDRIYQFIDQNYHRPIRLADAAKLAHMSDGAFSRFFRAHMGKTFPAFVNDLRIGRACRLLAESEMPITEIALSCGYRNLSNFNRQFLQAKRLSPSDFRRQMRRLD
jgi:AraC-like DNA-binding protein